jgi:Na+-translocating ferredoxin:NAD+ oxidoreductase subunit B
VNRSPPELLSSFEAIDAVLPQTQCTRCGYPTCRLYAQAIASAQAPINQCPPGGDAGIRRLAELTGLPYQPLNPAHGREAPRQLAVIDESACIGCTLCIAACPVDAIVGGNKRMHTVISEDCTGCELCVAPCPVDCIQMQDTPVPLPWTAADADMARQRFDARERRLAITEKTAHAAAIKKETLSEILQRARHRAAHRQTPT